MTMTEVTPTERTHTLHLTHKVSNQLLMDVLTTAVEGGITYWVEVADRIERDADLNVLVVHGIKPDGGGPDGDESKRYTATLFTVMLGLSRLLGGRVKVDPAIIQSIHRALAEDDAGEIDAYAADVIVQVGLFGEIVYG